MSVVTLRKKIHRPHDIGLVSVDRFLIAVPDDGLGRQVEDDLRPGGVKGGLQLVPVPDVTDDRGHFPLQPCKLEEVLLGRGR